MEDARERFSPTPREEPWLRRGIREFVATDARMSFIDVFSTMVDATGAPLPELYGDDKLHLNQLGYASWVEVIGPALGPPD